MKYILAICFCCCHFLLAAQTASVKLLNASGVEISTHVSISQAYAALPDTLYQAYHLVIQNNYTAQQEVYPLTFVPKHGSSDSNRIYIYPAVDVDSIVLTSNQLHTLIQWAGADYITLDGRPGAVGNHKAIIIRNTATQGNTLRLFDGACHNRLQYLEIYHVGYQLPSQTLSIETSPNDSMGNSHNIFSHLLSVGSRNGINSLGTAAHPNFNNQYTDNEVTHFNYSAIWLRGGNKRVTIARNRVHNTGFVANTHTNGIIYEQLQDSCLIYDNHVYNLAVSNALSVNGIGIRSALISGTQNHALIYNNFIAHNRDNSFSTRIVGIEVGGSQPMVVKIWHNSVCIGGFLNPDAQTLIMNSACFVKTANHSNLALDVRNNIFVNNRYNLRNQPYHFGVALLQNGGQINLNYNTYNCTEIGRTPSAIAVNLANFQTLLGGTQEHFASLTPVDFVSITDLHLTGSSVGNLGLAGLNLAEVELDIDGQQRTDFPYRGADEATVALARLVVCDSVPNPGSIIANDSILCNGYGSILLTHQGYSTGIGLTHQWEISSDNINFQPIALAMRDTHTVYSASQHWYRVRTHCRENNRNFYSDTLRIYSLASAKTGNLHYTHQGGFTHFQLQQSLADSFRWDFGDGSPPQSSLTPNISHVYASNSAYLIKVWAFNRCGNDSLFQNISIPLSVSENQLQRNQIYPSPSSGMLTFNNQQAWTIARLLDMQHKIYWQANMVEGINQWDLSQLPAGLYHFVVDKHPSQPLHFKWIKF